MPSRFSEGMLRRVNYGSFDLVTAGDRRGEDGYTSALKEMMAVYEQEARRRGGPAKDKVAMEAISDVTNGLPKVYRAYMARSLDTEREKNRGLEEVLDRMFQDGQGPAEYQRTYNAHRYGSPGRATSPRRSPRR